MWGIYIEQLHKQVSTGWGSEAVGRGRRCDPRPSTSPLPWARRGPLWEMKGKEGGRQPDSISNQVNPFFSLVSASTECSKLRWNAGWGAPLSSQRRHWDEPGGVSVCSWWGREEHRAKQGIDLIKASLMSCSFKSWVPSLFWLRSRIKWASSALMDRAKARGKDMIWLQKHAPAKGHLKAGLSVVTCLSGGLSWVAQAGRGLTCDLYFCLWTQITRLTCRCFQNVTGEVALKDSSMILLRVRKQRFGQSVTHPSCKVVGSAQGFNLRSPDSRQPFLSAALSSSPPSTCPFVHSLVLPVPIVHFLVRSHDDLYFS